MSDLIGISAPDSTRSTTSRWSSPAPWPTKDDRDFALLAHKLMDMQNIRVLFALAQMEDRVHVVARSRQPEVDVAESCA